MSITPSIPDYDGCLWPVDPACLTSDWEGLDPEVQERSLALASATLRRLTGYRVGGCPITVRPCKRSCATEYGYWDGSGFTPHINMLGQWVNAGCGCYSDACACGPICEVTLPGPVYDVTEVKVGSTDITSDTKVQGDKLVYTGTDDCPFPSCQDLSKAPGEDGTFAVTYMNSRPVDGLGAYAAGILAMEYAKACSGAKGCRLPKGVTTVTRAGVTYEIVAGSFPDGVTGMAEVDAYLALWRTSKSPKWAPRFWSPTLASPRVN